MADTASKVALTIISSLIVALIAMIFITTNILPGVANLVIIPVLAYTISIAVSSIFQYSSCGSVNIGSISLSNLFVLGTNAIASLVLYLEGIPFLKQIFGVYAPRNPYDGMPYEEGTAPWIKGMENENHYKIQFFSSIVKAVIPMYVDDSMKNGLVYFYWIFWMTILPLFFLLSMQSMCP
jgi:hypothetical protein